MKRQFIVVGLAAFVLLLLTFISATLAAPGNAPLRQSPEQEPNDSFAEADARPLVPVPGYVTGVVSETDTMDYFKMNNQNSHQYKVTLNVLGSTGNLQLMMRLYDGSKGLLGSSSSSISWTAYTTTHYVRVEALLASTTTVQSAQYRLDIDELAETPTPTPSSTPTASPTPTSTPPPSVTENDKYENNYDQAHAYKLPVSASVSLSSLEGLANFYPDQNDQDWFKFWAKNGKWYQVTTSNLNGVDTYIEIRDRNNNVIKSNDDYTEGYASRTSWGATYDGYYYIRVTNRVNTSGTYDMSVQESDVPPPDATATPGPGPSTEADSCEDNLDFDHACVIATNKSYTFNLHPPFGGTDNDYYKIWVKPGFIYKCATSDLDPGIDPNMIVYDQNRHGIGGNDDVAPGNFNSAFTYYASYEGWLYVLLGTGARTPSDINHSNYTLLCQIQIPGQPTSTPGPGATSTPHPQATSTPRPTNQPTSTPNRNLTVRPMTTPTPVLSPEPAATPAPHFIPITLLVYYDGNGDRQPGAGEGIAGISAQAHDAATNQLLAQGFTDEQGNIDFTVSASGAVRVSVPFFGFSQLVSGDGASIYLRVPPQTLPGGTP